MRIPCSYENCRVYSGVLPQSQVKKEASLIGQHKGVENLVNARENQV